MPEAPTANAVNDLADLFWEGFLERAPTYATQIGDERYDDRWDDPGPEGRRRDRAATADIHDRAVAMDRHALEVEDLITLDMLETATRIRLAEHDQHLYELAAVDQMAGPQQAPGELAAVQRVDTPERFERLIRRLEGYPAYIQAWIGVLDDAVASGRMAAPAVMERTLEQVERMVATPVADSPLVARHPELPEGQAARLRRAVAERVLPAQGRFLEAIRAAASRVRAGDGIWSIPDGEAAYRTLILAQTTLEASPRELHDYGLAQIESIDRERSAIARELGHRDIAGLRAALDADPANRAAEPEDLVRLASAIIERAMAAAPRWFGRLPGASCVVRAVEPFREQEAAPAFYLPPAADGSRPGTYYINTFRPEERPLHRLASTTFHEAVPGHHFQIALEGELENLVPFRRHGSRLAGIAYTEGWGLYSERLADEMGLYATPQERLGMLDAQAWRAARLVVDTGIHAFRWERQRSVDFLVGIGLSPLEASTETDRYISWPGQALAYMCGQREIQALRAQLATRDGDRFDLRGFHDAVLAHGSLPLATLRHELPTWVAPLA